MKIAMIAAMAKGRVIGADNGMPWHLPADLKHFKQTTLGKPVIMGRKTYESIGRALPGRTNIVVSSQSGYALEDAIVVSSPEDALNVATTSPDAAEEVMVIGGGKIYETYLPSAKTLYLTFIELDVEGDTCFPDYEAQASWKETERQNNQPDERNPHAYAFVTLERVL